MLLCLSRFCLFLSVASSSPLQIVAVLKDFCSFGLSLLVGDAETVLSDSEEAEDDEGEAVEEEEDEGDREDEDEEDDDDDDDAAAAEVVAVLSREDFCGEDGT
jgi:hypothetical protein